MCNRLPEIKKNGDAGIFPVYYSLKTALTHVIKLAVSFFLWDQPPWKELPGSGVFYDIF